MTTLPRRAAAAMTVALALTVLGCGASTAPPARRHPAPSPTASVLDGGCVTPADHGRVVALPEADGQPTYGVLLGSGPRGVVLSHQSDGTLCQLLPLARKLVVRDFHVMLWDVQHDRSPS